MNEQMGSPVGHPRSSSESLDILSSRVLPSSSLISDITPSHITASRRGAFSQLSKIATPDRSENSNLRKINAAENTDDLQINYDYNEGLGDDGKFMHKFGKLYEKLEVKGNQRDEKYAKNREEAMKLKVQQRLLEMGAAQQN